MLGTPTSGPVDTVRMRSAVTYSFMSVQATDIYVNEREKLIYYFLLGLCITETEIRPHTLHCQFLTVDKPSAVDIQSYRLVLYLILLIMFPCIWRMHFNFKLKKPHVYFGYSKLSSCIYTQA
jgi:hypothetical protein